MAIQLKMQIVSFDSRPILILIILCNVSFVLIYLVARDFLRVTRFIKIVSCRLMNKYIVSYDVQIASLDITVKMSFTEITGPSFVG